MRRFYLAGSLIAMMLICSIAPRSLEAGSGGKWERSAEGKFSEKFGGEMVAPVDFPSFLQFGTGRALAPGEGPVNVPRWHIVPLSVKPADIILVKARSSSFNLNPYFAPLAGPFKPRTRADYPTLFPYSMMPVPQDGQFRYQASYVSDFAIPAHLGFTNTDTLPHEGPGMTGSVNWDYRYAVAYRHDQYEAQWEPRGWANDADQNPDTTDKPIRRAQWFWPMDGHWAERGLFWQSDTNFDREDWFHFDADGTGTLDIKLECGNGTWSNWNMQLKLYDTNDQLIAATRGSGTSLALNVPYQPRMTYSKEEPSNSNYFRLQIYGSPAGKPATSNVYYMPYKVSVRQIQK